MLKILQKNALLSALQSVSFATAIVATFISAITIILTGHTLTPEKAFMLLLFMRIIRRDVSTRLTFLAPSVLESLVSLARTQKFLLLQNLPLGYRDGDKGCTRIYGHSNKDNGYHPLLCNSNTFRLVIQPKKNAKGNDNKISDSPYEQHPKESQYGLTVSGATCSITGFFEKCILCEVSFDAPPQSLIVITGKVGSGKSTLLSAIAGEVILSSGKILYTGNIGYVSQRAWVFSGTIRDNILFGKMYDERKFAKVVEVCALQEDISRFPRGDLTFVGEHGVVLSGGQRARVSLARAVYADADVYLLDDPLSAVDVKVGEHIFSQCICQHLGGKIRILVTHSKRHMKKAYQVVVLEKGSVMQKGNFSELKVGSEANYALGLDLDSNNKRINQVSDVRDRKTNNTSDASTGISPSNSGSDSGTPEHLEVCEEDRAIGAISFKLYWKYFRAGMHPVAIFAAIVLFLATQGKLSHVRTIPGN